MSWIFISYSRQDIAPARAIAKALQGASHDVWCVRVLERVGEESPPLRNRQERPGAKRLWMNVG